MSMSDQRTKIRIGEKKYANSFDLSATAAKIKQERIE